MASLFDQFAKDVLDLLLSAHGRIETEFEVPALKAQRADVLFEPDPAHDAARRTLGLLGRMSDRCCLFEPFHEAPDAAEVTACLRKLLNHRHARALAHRPAAERAWLLCAGRPDGALRSFRAVASAEWTRGFYDLGESLPLWIVVLAELEEDEDTLALRLMGAGATLRRALLDLQQTPAGEVRDALVRRVVELHITRDRGMMNEEDELMRQLPFVEELERRCRAEGLSQGLTQGLSQGLTQGLSQGLSQGLTQGLSQGLTEGTLLALTRIVERRLRRELSTAEREALRERLAQLGDRALDDALDLDARVLDRWLTCATG